MKNKLTVSNEYGTFTRTTARKYQYVVISRDHSAATIEARAARTLANEVKSAAAYEAAALCAEANNCNVDIVDGSSYNQGQYLRAHGLKPGAIVPITSANAEQLSGWSAAEWRGYLDGSKATIAAHAKTLAKKLAKSAASKHFVQGWSSRLDLAKKVADTARTDGYMEVHVLEVATGKAVA